MEKSITSSWFLILLVFVFLLAYNWKKRWVYYYGLRFSALSTIPAALKMSWSLKKDFPKALRQMCNSRPPVFSLWALNKLYIINSEPKDLEILLTTFLEKNYVYKFWEDVLNESVFTLPVSVWKKRRREMNRTFNSKILASFHEVFVKYAKENVKAFEELCGTEQTELMFGLWDHNLNAALEALMDITPATEERLHDAIAIFIRGEKLVMQRRSKFWLLYDIIFRFSNLRKETEAVCRSIEAFGRKVVRINKQQVSTNSNRKKCFLNHLCDWSEGGIKMPESDLSKETVNMAIASSETTSAAMVSVILALGLLSDVQEKVYQETSSILTDGDDPTLDDINRMDYSERVIKETLRLLPIVPLITRSIDKTIKLGSFVYPAGSNLAIPIAYVHRRPDIWPDPSKFDPDRFLPEETAKRHRCAFIPFSFGPRKCIGSQYAMMSMKVQLAYIVKNFKIKALNYRSLDDLESDFYLVSKVKGYRVIFERRTDSNN